MNRWVLLVALVPAVAHADDRCAQGEALAHKGDLPRAALYLDGCEGAALRDVKKKLEASDLSKLDITSTPEGVVVEVDTLPGERLTTPATVWVRAGHHVVKGERVTGAIDVKPRTHATLILEAPKPAAAPTNGHANFDEENAGEVSEVGKLPDVKHRPMLNCKYTGSCPASGEQIDDPLARHEDAPPSYRTLSFELRAGASDLHGRVSSTLAPTVSLNAWRRITDSEHPFAVGYEGAYARRASVEEVSGIVELHKVIAAADTAWLSLGLGGGDSSYFGLQAAASIDLQLRRLPISVAANYRQASFAYRVITIEVGWRFLLLD